MTLSWVSLGLFFGMLLENGLRVRGPGHTACRGTAKSLLRTAHPPPHTLQQRLQSKTRAQATCLQPAPRGSDWKFFHPKRSHSNQIDLCSSGSRVPWEGVHCHLGMPGPHRHSDFCLYTQLRTLIPRLWGPRAGGLPTPVQLLQPTQVTFSFY